MPRPVDRDGENERLRQQMQFDALQPMNIFDLADETNEGLQKPSPSMKTDLTTLSEEKIEEAIFFLRLNVRLSTGLALILVPCSQLCAINRRHADWPLSCNICANITTTVSGVAHSTIAERISIATVRAMTRTLTTEIWCLMYVAGATA